MPLELIIGEDSEVLTLEEAGPPTVVSEIGQEVLVISAIPSGGGGGSAVSSVNGQTGDVTITKTSVGLANVDNTSDLAKPISTATQTALNNKQASDPDLTAIAALTPSNDDFIQRKSGAWANRTPAQVKTDLGISNLDNTSDMNKPVSTAQQAALDGKEDAFAAGTTGQYLRGDKTWQTLDKAAAGLGNVDNTSDMNKPVSTAQQAALDGKQNADPDLTALGSLAPTDDDLIQRKAGTWSTRTPAQVKTDFALNNVDNTSDMNKPVSTAQQAAINKRLRFLTGTSATAVGTAAKTVTISGETLAANDLVILTLTNGNTAASPTLAVNGGAAIPIYLGGSALTAAAGTLAATGVWFLLYDGSRFNLTGVSNNLTVPSQADAEAGVSTTPALWTPERVAQAVAALAPAGGGDAELPWFHPKDYGAVGDGVADDTAAVQAAADAARVAGGTVYIGGKSNTTYAISGPVNFYGATGVFGDGSLPQIEPVGSTFKFTSTTAQIRLAGRTSPADTTSRGASFHDFSIDGNDFGDTDGALFIDFGASRDFYNIAITGVAGDGLVLDTTQNSTFSAIEITGCGGTGIVLDNGAGGNQFLRCEIASCAIEIETRDTRPGAHSGYPFGPGRNQFLHCLFEDYNSGGEGVAIGRFTHGQTTRFVSCAFSASAQNQSSGFLVQITTGGSIQTEVIFADGCTFYGFGGTDAIYVGANARVVVEGSLGAGAMDYVFSTDGVSYGRIEGRVDYLAPTALYSDMGATGTFSQWRGIRHFGMDIISDMSATHAVPLRFLRAGEAQHRLLINDDGLIHFNNGVSGASLATLGWDNTNSHNSHIGGLVQWGRRGHVRSLNAAATGAVTIDSKATSVHTLITTGSITSMTISNAVTNAELTIQITKGNVAHTIAWPSNIRWANNRLPLVSASNYTFVHLRYDSGDSTWKEIGRTEETGTSTRIGPGINPPRFIACTSATAAGTAAKTVTIAEPTTFEAGDVFVVTLTNGNTAANPTLAINGGSALGIYLGGTLVSAEAAALSANGTWFVRWNGGSVFQLLGPSGNYALVSQATAEAGTSTTVTHWTPERVRQAANAAILAGGGVGEEGPAGAGANTLFEIKSIDASHDAAKAATNLDNVNAYLYGTEWIENWTDLSGWNDVNLQVSSNWLYSTGGGGEANKSFSIAAGETAQFTVIARRNETGVAASQYFGLDFGTADHAPNTGDTFMGLGFDTLGNMVALREGTVNAGVQWAAYPAAGTDDGLEGFTPSGNPVDYLMTITFTKKTISFCIKEFTSGGRNFLVESIDRTAVETAYPGGTYNLAIRITDSRALTGHRFSRIARTNHLGPSRNSLIDHLAQSSHIVRASSSLQSTESWKYEIPAGYDPRIPTPLVINFHQSVTGNFNTPWADDRMQPITEALVDAGYIVAAFEDGSNDDGDRWGNQTSLTNILALYNQLKDAYNIGQVFFMSQSMGGLPMSNLIQRKEFPTPAAAASIGGAHSIHSLLLTSGASSIRPDLRAAYGIASDDSDWATKTDGYDPIRELGYDFRGVPWRFYYSTGDSVVVPADHALAMVTLLDPWTTEASTYVATGGHMDDSFFDADDLLEFFERYRKIPEEKQYLEVAKTASGSITLDTITEGLTNKYYTQTEKTKLAGIATGATANSSDATLLARANHTGTQSADTVVDGSTNKAYTATEKTKLSGIATGATANDTDANLKARANHTGTQSADTITDGSTNKVLTAANATKLTNTPNFLVLNAADAVPGGTPSGTIIFRRP